MVLAHLRRTLAERELLTAGDHVLVACSGGGDSVALLDLLHRLAPELGISLHVVSFDHGLRPASAMEVRAVKTLSAELGLPFTARALALAPGAGVQARARVARYAALAELCEELGATKVATGHTRDDQAETVLARVLRGHGLEGMAGVAPAREDGVIRPLLECGREELREHLAHVGLAYVDDPSNNDERFERVRIRSLLAELTREDPRVREHLARLADEVRCAVGVLGAQASQARELAGRRGEGLERASLVGLSDCVLDRVWREHLRAAGHEVSYRALAGLRALVRSGRGEVRVAAGLVVRAEGPALVLALGASPTRSGG